MGFKMAAHRITLPLTMKQNPTPWFQTATLENIPDGTELIFDRNGGREVTKRSIARVCRMLANILRGALRDELGFDRCAGYVLVPSEVMRRPLLLPPEPLLYKGRRSV